MPAAVPLPSARPSPIAILGIPFDNVTTADTLQLIEEMIASGQPHYLATANVDFVAQAFVDVELQRILFDAHLVVADGMPLVWASRWLGNPLPERVTGSDLTPRLLADAERKGWRVYFLGGTEQSVATAAENTRRKHPKLQLVGAYSPPFKPLSEMDDEDILRRIRAVKPDLLLVAFGCPKQEKWINAQYQQSGVPVSIGVGATIDFLAGTVTRAPRWMQRTGLEWAYRLCQEPRRLFRRYLVDFWVFGRAVGVQCWQLRASRRARSKSGQPSVKSLHHGALQVLVLPPRFDAAAVQNHERIWLELLATAGHLIVDAAAVDFIDSTGVGLLVRLQKNLRTKSRRLVVAGPPLPVRRALDLMRFTDFMDIAPNVDAAGELLACRAAEQVVVATLNLSSPHESLAWQTEVVAANADEVWDATAAHIELCAQSNAGVTINMKGLRFIDTTGVRLMVRARKQGHLRGITVTFADPPPRVLNVIRTLRMESYLLGSPA